MSQNQDDPQRAALLSILSESFAPQYAPPPAEDPKTAKIRTVLAALADVAKGISTAKGYGQHPSSLDARRATEERRQAILAANANAQGAAKLEGRQRTAEYQLKTMDANQAKRDAAAEKAKAQQEDFLQGLRSHAASRGVVGAANMDTATLYDEMAKIERADKAAKAKDQAAGLSLERDRMNISAASEERRQKAEIDRYLHEQGQSDDKSAADRIKEFKSITGELVREIHQIKHDPATGSLYRMGDKGAKEPVDLQDMKAFYQNYARSQGMSEDAVDRIGRLFDETVKSRASAVTK